MRREPFGGLVAGVGAMGLHHLRALGATPGVGVLAVVDPDPVNRARAAEAWGVRSYELLGAALAHEEPDFVCVATPPEALPVLTREALEAGAAVLVEKPMAADEETASALIAMAESRGAVLAVGYVERANPAVRAVKALVDAGVLGALRTLRATRFVPGDGRRSSAGVALDLATHDLDVMRHLVGSEISRVSALAAPDGAVAAEVEFDGGAVGSVEADRTAETAVRELRVAGERGTVLLDYRAQQVTLLLEGEPARRVPVEPVEPLRNQWDDFAGALRGEPMASATGADALAALSAVRAIERSAATGEPAVPAGRTLRLDSPASA